jgi:hypothetical protein
MFEFYTSILRHVLLFLHCQLEAKATVSVEDLAECKEGDTASGAPVGVSCEGESSVPSLQVQEAWPDPPPLSTDENIDGSEAEGAEVEQQQLDEQTQEQPVTPTQDALVYLMYVEFFLRAYRVYLIMCTVML